MNWIEEHKTMAIVLFLFVGAGVFVYLNSEYIAGMLATGGLGLLIPNDKTRKLKKEVTEKEHAVVILEEDRQQLKKRYNETKKKHAKEVQDAKEDYSGLDDDRLIALARERGLLQSPDSE